MTFKEGSDDAGGGLKVWTVDSAHSRTARRSEMEARSPEQSVTVGELFSTLLRLGVVDIVERFETIASVKDRAEQL